MCQKNPFEDPSLLSGAASTRMSSRCNVHSWPRRAWSPRRDHRSDYYPCRQYFSNAVLFVLGAASARVVRDRVQSDQRRIIKVYDRFGFSGRVGVDIDVKDDYVHFKEGTSPQEQKQGRGRMGFVLGYDAFEYILEQLAQDPSTCPISATSSSTQETQWVTLLDFSAFGDHGEYNFEEINQHTADGWLSVWFINCVPGSMVSFDITVKMFNTGSDGTRSYISVGEEPLIG